jgi:uncharacterized protein YeaO (DUF488 family)
VALDCFRAAHVGGTFESPALEYLRREGTTRDHVVVPQPPGARVARVYDPPTPADGARVLVDRLWPRGLRKENANLATWCKEVAPSNELRSWYGHDPDRFEEFAGRYRSELEGPVQAAAFETLLARWRRETVTLLTATKALELSHAVVLAAVLSEGT